MCKEPLYMHKVPMCKGHLVHCKYYHLVLNWHWPKIVPIQKMDQPAKKMLKSHAKYQNLKFQFSRVVENFKLNVSLKKIKIGWKMGNCHLWGFSFFGWFHATFKIGQEENHVGRGMLKSHEI